MRWSGQQIERKKKKKCPKKEGVITSASNQDGVTETRQPHTISNKNTKALFHSFLLYNKQHRNSIPERRETRHQHTAQRQFSGLSKENGDQNRTQQSD